MKEDEKVVMEGAELRLRNRRVALLRSREQHPVYGGSVWKMRFKFLNLAKPREVVTKEVHVSDQSMKALLRLYVEQLQRDGDPDAVLAAALL